MEKVIISGSTGFIGAHFVDFLVAKGIDVLALGRKPFNSLSNNKKKKLEGATYINLDMREIDHLEREIAKLGWKVGDDCIFFNLAWGGVDRLSDLNIEAQLNNVVWSEAALDVSFKIGCCRFVQIGTMEEAFTYRYLDLDYHTNNEYNRHLIYSVAKIAAKQALQLKASLLGMDFIYVKHSHVMGDEDDKDSFLQVTLQKLILGEDLVFSSGEQYFDVISLEDCALGYFLIGQKGISGSDYWVGSGDPRKLREYVERMYNLFPSSKEMQFGILSYNDIVLSREDFSIQLLNEHTGYLPSMSYEQTVRMLHKSLTK